jgi:hypothetical protein
MGSDLQAKRNSGHSAMHDDDYLDLPGAIEQAIEATHREVQKACIGLIGAAILFSALVIAILHTVAG